MIDAGNDWIMRAITHGDEEEPGFGKGAKYGSWWANNAEFNPDYQDCFTDFYQGST